VPALFKERPEPTVTINPADAEARGIGDGDLVLLKTLRGQVNMRAFVTDDIMPGTIDASMGGGGPVGPKAWQECNINELTDLQRYDPISGFPVYKALLCEVMRVTGSVGTVKMDSGEDSLKAAAHHADAREKQPRIYLDHNATTPIAPEVDEAMARVLKEHFGNPSGIYREGREAHGIIEGARRSVAQLLNCTAKRIIFTSGGSESNNLVLKGVAFANRGGKDHIITTAIEHPSVLAACEWLEDLGFRITRLPVDRTGMVDPQDLLNSITPKTCLASIMMANNEIGTIQPIAELAAIAKERGVLFHTDAVQAAGRIPLDVEALDIDFLSLSAHKLYGPKGAGILYMGKDAHILPLIHGGKQERGLRAGTENVAAAAGFGKAAELAIKNLPSMQRVAKMRDSLQTKISENIADARLNGDPGRRLPNTLNMTLPGFRGESLVLALDQKGLSLSSGSACRSGSPKPSHVLLAIGLSEEEAHCTVRLSLGPENTFEEIDRAADLFEEVVKGARNSVRFVPCR
jgi:cysteine desulfurase NifS